MEILMVIGIILLIILLVGYLYFENTNLKVTNYIVKSSNIPKEFNNYKIVQISDYHNEENRELNTKLVSEIKSSNPDAIFITGDLIYSRGVNIYIAISLIKKIKNIAPIYFVIGNHETSVAAYKDLEKELINEGVNILKNQKIVIEKNNSKINILGINDPKLDNISEKNNKKTANKAIHSIKYDKSLYTILLSHRPEIFDIYVKNNIDLVLAGHAHGGQIRFFKQGLIAPGQGLFPKYTSGVYEKKNTKMVVSRGIGKSIFPFRVNNRPEVVVVTLKK